MYTLLRFPILVACILLSAPSFRAAPIPEEREATNLSVTPEVIRINAFYKGTDVEVSADLPIDCTGAVVKIQGDDEEITLKRKGRVYFFWLNIDDVTISDAPDVYILNSSIPLDRLRAVDPQHTLLLGYDALKEHINIRCKNALSGSEFSEFIKLKEHNGSYQENATAQLLPAAGKTHNSFKAVLHIPPVMPSGEYRIQYYPQRGKSRHPQLPVFSCFQSSCGLWLVCMHYRHGNRDSNGVDIRFSKTS